MKWNQWLEQLKKYFGLNKVFKLLLLLVFLPQLASAAKPRFWVEPYLMYSQVQEVEDIAVDPDDSIAGPGGGINLFGFFTQNLFLGVKGSYTYFTPESDLDFETYNQTIFSAGPLVGIFASRFRLYFSYFIFDNWTQTFQLTSTSTETTSEMEGGGYGLGASFWVWPNFALAVEYDTHSYDRLDGNILSDKIEISVLNILLTFPFEL